MGTLIPDPMDQEIVFRLNTIFSGANFLPFVKAVRGY